MTLDNATLQPEKPLSVFRVPCFVCAGMGCCSTGSYDATGCESVAPCSACAQSGWVTTERTS